jgi:hypothetical protein
VRDLADQTYARLKQDPRHPSLRFKKVRVHYRALAVEAPDGLVSFWIDSHADRDRLLGEQPHRANALRAADTAR